MAKYRICFSSYGEEEVIISDFKDTGLMVLKKSPEYLIDIEQADIKSAEEIAEYVSLFIGRELGRQISSHYNIIRL